MARVPRIGGDGAAPKPADRPEWPPHFCPGCGTQRKPFPRYPWHFCPACCDRAEDCDGRRLAFGNVSITGGFYWLYADDRSRWDPRALDVICLIDRRPVVVGEARFGGVVAQPLQDDYFLAADGRDNVVNLVNAAAAGKARARLVPVERAT